MKEIVGEDISLDEIGKSKDNATASYKAEGHSLIKFLCDSLAILWKDWPRDMKVTILDDGNHVFSLVCTVSIPDIASRRKPSILDSQHFQYAAL